MENLLDKVAAKIFRMNDITCIDREPKPWSLTLEPGLMAEYIQKSRQGNKEDSCASCDPNNVIFWNAPCGAIGALPWPYYYDNEGNLRLNDMHKHTLRWEDIAKITPLQTCIHDSEVACLWDGESDLAKDNCGRLNPPGVETSV